VAKKNGSASLERPSLQNPFQHVPFSQQDLNSIDRDGGGGAKMLVDVTPEYRAALISTLEASKKALAAETRQYPEALSTLIFKLRDIGIAKSHRPLTLTKEAKLLPAGHAKIDEMLVGANSVSIAELNRVITTRGTKAIMANLSAIEKIEPWTRSRRNPEGIVALRAHGRALIRLFRYGHDQITRINYESILALFKKLGISNNQIFQSRGLPLFSIPNLDQVDDDALELLLNYPGARQIFTDPIYKSFAPQISGETESNSVIAANISPTDAPPIVAIFDSGISPDAQALNGWVVGRDTYVLPPDTNFEHGTMVASLAIAARHFNDGHDWLPQLHTSVYDVCALETAGSHMSDLEERLQQAVKRRPDIKVWNISLGGDPCDEHSFSEFSQALDHLSDRYNVLFVVAAGNYNGEPRRGWPNPAMLSDRVSIPGESVRALTVASITHMTSTGALTAAGDPSPYSRRGPGPVFTPKPDITHVGGGVHAPWIWGDSSIKVVAPGNTLRSVFGTSFAAPIAASMAAHAWQAVKGHPSLTADASLIKALMVHSAQLSSPDYERHERRYYGAGRPNEIMRTLYDSDDSFTLVFQAKVAPSMRWRKSPYPIPKALIHNGKFRGEIIITAAYAPPLDPDAGSEYVRANIELSFGVLDGDRITGKVPLEGEEGQSGYESAQVEHGGKWSPIKVHRKSFPQGTTGDEWAVQAAVVMRALEPELQEALPVTIIVTLRSLNGDMNVHADGLRALAATNWVRSTLPIRVPVQAN
jgi:serine protease AprX